jgi:hypothetical protein
MKKRTVILILAAAVMLCALIGLERYSESAWIPVLDDALLWLTLRVGP